jgi:predicted nucleic acid-binding Zn ribbon protein
MIYIWKCEVCGNEQPVSRRIKEHNVPPDKCEECGHSNKTIRDSLELEDYNKSWTKIITPTNFTLQGGGWFKDGYNKKVNK